MNHSHKTNGQNTYFFIINHHFYFFNWLYYITRISHFTDADFSTIPTVTKKPYGITEVEKKKKH